MKTLYVTDLDGTLLNTRDSINEYSLQVINQLINKGMLFTYATARSLVSASVVTKGLLVQHPVIVYNGAFIMDPSTRRIFKSTGFTKQEMNIVIDTLHKYHISPLVYSFVQGKEKVSWITTKENEGMKRYLSLRQGDERLRPLDDETQLFDGDIFYFTCIGEKEELMPMYQEICETGKYRCTLQQELYREEYWCEIMPQKATKANAILELKEMLGCDRIVSFGDAINDIPMFQISNECYAVANAVDELKDAAVQVIESNDHDGVAKWLMEHLDNK